MPGEVCGCPRPAPTDVPRPPRLPRPGAPHPPLPSAAASPAPALPGLTFQLLCGETKKMATVNIYKDVIQTLFDRRG